MKVLVLLLASLTIMLAGCTESQKGVAPPPPPIADPTPDPNKPPSAPAPDPIPDPAPNPTPDPGLEGGGNEGGGSGNNEGGGSETTPKTLSYTLRKTLTGSGGFGWSVANAGDVNGDGISDYIVGAPSLSTTYVYSGADDSPIYSTTKSNKFGISVASFGANMLVRTDTSQQDYLLSGADGSQIQQPTNIGSNLNVSYETLRVLTGLGDNFVSANFHDSSDRGKVTVFSGNNLSAVFSVQGENDTAGRFGWSIANLGDIDEKGKDDFIVGAPKFFNSNSQNNRGRVYLYSGDEQTKITFLAEDATHNTVYDFGYAVAGLGDVDGDGIGDFAVTALMESMSAGSFVYVYSGATRAKLYTISGSDFFGQSLAPLGDADGDGKGDLLIGDPEHKKVSLYSGANGTVVTQVQYISGNNQISFNSLAGIGDVNGDGKPDFIVGAKEGSVYVYVSQLN